MKKLIVTSLIAFFAFNLFAQVKFGLRAGFAAGLQDVNEVQLGNGDTLGLTDIKGGIHFGVVSQIQISKFFIQPEVLFNSNTANYTLSSDKDENGVRNILKERYNNIDVPVMMGYKTGSLRLQAGPVGHVHVSNTSDLLNRDGFMDAFKSMTYGYQAGIGLDIWKLMVDIKYEGNFTDFDEHIQFDNMNVELSDAPKRWVFTVGYTF